MKKILSIAIALPFVLVGLTGCTSELSTDESQKTPTSTTEISTEGSDFSYNDPEENSSEEEKIEEEEKEEKEEKKKSKEEEEKPKQDKVDSKEEKKQEEVDKQESSSKKSEKSKEETDSSTQNKTTTQIETGSKEQTTTTAPRQSTTSPSSSSPSSSNSSSLSAIEMEVVNLVNKERKARGLQSLQVDPGAANVAGKKSLDMKNNNYFSHQSPTYGSPFQMLKQFGVSYRSAGENIAAGQKTAQEVMNSWMNSSGHRANILNPSFTHIGVGYVQGGSYGTYWTQIFIQK